MWSYWERGERVPPQDVVTRIEAESGGTVTAASWAQVREAFLTRKREQAEAQAQDAAITRMLASEPEPSSADAGGPDAALLALAPELEAAAGPYLAYDRDLDVEPGDPDCEETPEHHRTLSEVVDAVAERILAHEPRTIAGLLLVAHAAAVTAEDRWDEVEDDDEGELGRDGRRLRAVANGLFRLAGVDWRGRPLLIAGRRPEHPPPPSPDAAMLALAPELDAAAGALFDLEDVDHFLVPGSRGHDALMAYCGAVRQRADAVAERILAHTPRTFAGLLLIARAVAATAGARWDAPHADLNHGEILLRTLGNALFTFGGIDWRGRPLATAVPTRLAAREAETRAADPLLVSLVRQWQTATRATNDSAIPDDMRSTFSEEVCRLQRAIYAYPARSLADLCAKLPALRDEAEHSEETPGTGDDVALETCALRCLVADLERLSAGEAPPRAADPVYAAIAASRAALDEHIAACCAPDADSEGDARRSAACDAHYKAWCALLAMTPATVAGAQALASYALDHIERDGCWNDGNNEQDARVLLRAIAAAGRSDGGAAAAEVAGARAHSVPEDATLTAAAAE